MFSFDTPLFLIQDDPTKLWPAVVLAFLMFIIRWSVDYIVTPTANRFTQYKIDANKPEWLLASNSTHKSCINHITSSPQILNNGSINKKSDAISEEQSNKLIELIDILPEKEINKLFNYASEIKLTDIQIRGLKSYFTLIKQYDIHKNKFLESTFKLICIIQISLYGSFVVYFKHDFFINHWKQWINIGDIPEDMRECNINYKNEPLTQVSDDWMKWYYIISLGYHLNRAMMQFHNPIRKDFVALLIHHWTTLALMLCSWIGGKVRIGCIVLSIHESSDIFLECAKLCSYCSLFWLADIFFVFFFLSWILFRMYFFCQKLLYGIYICGLNTAWLGNHPLIYPQACIYMLYVLEGLHIYWFKLILDVLRNKLEGKIIADVRSGSESEDESMKTQHEKDKTD